MAKIVAGIGMSHAPGALGWPDAPSASVRRRLLQAADRLGRSLDAARPDVIIAFLDDHFENHFRSLMPTVGIGVAASHPGPATQWLEALRLTRQERFGGAPEIAERLLRSLVADGYDVARMGEIEYGNNLMVPWKLMAPRSAPAIIPVFTNVFSPPVMPYRRAYAFGAALRNAAEALDADLRVAFMATGGMSHWPPFWNDSSPEADAFLARMKAFQTHGKSVLEKDPHLLRDLAAYEIEMAERNQWPLNSPHPLVNEAWDRQMLDALARGDVEFLCGLQYEDVKRDGGHGGQEIINWIELMGAMKGAPATLLEYEAVTEWICGMAYMDYGVAQAWPVNPLIKEQE